MPTLQVPYPMKSLPVTPEPEPLRWTAEEFHRLCDEGWFDGFRTMLLDGEILTMPLPNPPHNTALTLTHHWLMQIFTEGCYVRNQQAFDVDLRNDPGPDLAVVAGNVRDYAQRQPTTAIMIVKIADSSLKIDLGSKPHLYAQAGVPEYWVLDVAERVLHVFRNPVADAAAPRGHRYAESFTAKETATIALLARPEAAVAVSQLLP